MMTHGTARRVVLVAVFAAMGLAAGGCTGRPQPMGAVTNTPNANDPITLQRAGYLDIMLSNVYASGPLTQGAIMSVISGYGGGYVTTASESGAMGTSTQELTLNVVLGGGSVKDSMQGEGDFAPSGIACFTYTVGYYGYMGKQATQVACPASLTQASAQATAQRQLTTEADALAYEGSFTSVPASLAAAEAAVKLPPAGRTATRAADFAAGSGIAALAIPQSSGSCIYVVFREITSTVVGGGTARVFSGIVSKAWVAPTDATCDGTGALSAGAFLSVDRGAGG